MDSADLHDHIDDLGTSIDDLETSLAPLLNTGLSSSTSKLPLLDKAKLYVVATYAIESLLFSYLRLNSVDAKSHAIFQELSRVKQYFEKIKTVESAGLKPTSKLDKGAAGRFVRHALVGNDKYDKERAELAEREKAGAKRKFEDMTERVGSHVRFESVSKKIRADEKAGLERAEVSSDSGIEPVKQQDGSQHSSGQPEAGTSGQRSKKEQRKELARAEKQQRREAKKRSRADNAAMSQEESNQDVASTTTARRHKSHRPPKDAHEAFQGLLDGPLPKHDISKKKNHRQKTVQ